MPMVQSGRSGEPEYLRDGVLVPPGRGEEYVYLNQTVYVINGLAQVWKWGGSAWLFVGHVDADQRLATSQNDRAAANEVRQVVTSYGQECQRIGISFRERVDRGLRHTTHSERQHERN